MKKLNNQVYKDVERLKNFWMMMGRLSWRELWRTMLNGRGIPSVRNSKKDSGLAYS